MSTSDQSIDLVQVVGEIRLLMQQRKRLVTEFSTSADKARELDSDGVYILENLYKKSKIAITFLKSELCTLYESAQHQTDKFLINSLCAAKIEDGFILTRIMSYDKNSDIVEVRDDDDAEQLVYKLPSLSIIPLESGLLDTTHKKGFHDGEIVLALYPHTTTFYPGRVTGLISDQEYGVQFDGDDLDENGVNLVVQTVPVKFVVEFRA